MEIVLAKIENRIGSIILNRPEKRNALNEEMVIKIKAELKKFEKDASCKVIVIEANGDAFCAGADLDYLKKLQTNSFAENLKDSHNLMELFKMIRFSPKPIIAKVKGHALAGGSGLASVCDFCYATPESSFGYTEARIGFVPAIVMVFLKQKIGETATRELLLTGKLISASQAVEINLINKTVDSKSIDEEVQTLANSLIEKSSAMSMGYIKKMLAELEGKSFVEGLEYAARINAEARNSDDCKKGIAAFLGKETIKW